MNFPAKISRIISIVLMMCIVLIPIVSMAEETENDQVSKVNFYTYGDVSRPDTRISASKISGVDTLVLPTTVSEKALVLFCDSTNVFRVKGALAEIGFISGQSIDLTALCGKGEYLLEFIDGTTVHTLKFIFLSNIPSLYLVSEDPANEGRIWVDSSDDKSNKAKGSMVMIAEDGEVVHTGKLTQIKGRGNTTWGLVKKPYQIKLEDKVDLIRTGDNANKSKTWVLLANYLDPAGVRNTMALNLGNSLGMPMNVQGESIDLYYDGEYRGMYMLTEKVEVGSGRVAVPSLEEANEEANPDKDFEEFPIAEGKTENGATYTYCEGMVSPEDITGGYLLEMDYKVRALEEICYICTSRENYVVVKSPEFASKEEMDYIATMYQEFEDAVFGGGVNPTTNKKYSDYIDERSLAIYYIVNELSKSRDCFSSSAYLNKKPGEDKFVMGPLWDYDMSFGRGSYQGMYVDDDPFGLAVPKIQFGKALFDIKEFNNYVTNLYKNDVEPLVRNVILGDKNAVSENGTLHSLSYYRELIADSAECNTALWYDGQSWNEEANKLYHFVSQRYDELNKHLGVFSTDVELKENEYYDVTPTDWYYGVVTEASKKSMLNGDGLGFFNPRTSVTRAQAAQVIYNMSDIKTAVFKPVFADVVSSNWYSVAAVWAVINGYLSDYTDGNFKPDAVITREEFINALYRFNGSPAVDTTFLQEFVDKDKITAVNAVEWALKEDIIRGTDNCINPTGAMTRAEMAAILVRYCEAYK